MATQGPIPNLPSLPSSENLLDSPTESQVRENQPATTPVVSDASSPAASRRATGPRTAQGKKRSGRNAIKYGIFSETVVLPGESQAEFDAVVTGLQDYFRPDGKVEEILVEKLATLFWRHRRLLIAEGAEIRKATEFLSWDKQRHQENQVRTLSGLAKFCGGITRGISNPKLLERSLDLLEQLRDRIAANGFDLERDKPILVELYGEFNSNSGKDTLVYSYVVWSVGAKLSEDIHEQKDLPSAEECRNWFLCQAADEFDRLTRYGRAHARNEGRRMKLEVLRANVPDAPQLDRLLRYETSLDRAIDRTLMQLERYQRMRLGQSVPPPINVNVSSS